ncbi:MAG: PH domain-containing protein [Gammaproteobacteria bacterium]|nr:PH domain-containing protein [Gammaproteobacteria bacterium]NNC98138.1 PH domain-containing protein [Gammaproteobacteria bacterium]NNM12964.1 PH domain-containing protein [Gammaproteobacteria bacterium]
MTDNLKRIEKTHIKALRLTLLIWAVIVCGVLGVIAYVARDEILMPGIFLIAVLVFALLIIKYPRKVYDYTFYGLVDDVFYVQKGMWFKTRTAVAQNRIQHTDVQQGPIARRYDLATLTMHTAGMKEADIQISGLSHSDAIALRDHLLELNKAALTKLTPKAGEKPALLKDELSDLSPGEHCIATSVLALRAGEEE